MLHLLQVQRLVADQLQDATGRSDDNVRAVILQRVQVLLDANTAVKHYTQRK
jgi:hypothetical protein